MSTRPLEPGRAHPVAAVLAGVRDRALPYVLPAHHLVTHAVCVGMTGSGKTGLCIALVEEALRSRVPTLLIDVKGDLANLLLTFPELSPAEFSPWIDPDDVARRGRTLDAVAAETAQGWRDGLAAWGLSAADVAALRASTAVRVITPGTTACEPLHVLSSLETPSPLWSVDEEAARESLSSALSLLLRRIGRDGDGARSREHVLLALLAERRLRAGQPAALEDLVADLQRPPIARVGALSVDQFLPASERDAVAQDLNTLIASPTFATWRQGVPLDVGAWLAPRPDGRTPAVIVSVAHLDDDDRALVLSLVLEQLLAWVRSLPGRSDLRALVLFDEVFGFLPPHPASPPTKRPLLALLKQARAFGVGLALATQNPMDLDYKALSNAGLWFIGRLQTDADRERVVEGLSGVGSSGGALDPGALASVLKALPPRHFYVRDVRASGEALVLESRWTLSWLRGPMTRQELRRLAGTPPRTAATPAAPPPPPVAQTAAAPTPPEGWRVWFAALQHGAAPASWAYVPWVAATVVGHVRDARLGVHTTATIRAMAPLDADGRLDTARGRVFDPRWFAATPASGAAFVDLPAALARKGATAAIERAIRDEVYRTLKVHVHLHKSLGLTSADGEAPEAFMARCAAEAARRADASRTEAIARHAPRIQRATDKAEAARQALAALQQSSPVGGAVASAAALLRGGRRALQRLETQQDKLDARREKLRAELADAEAAQREAVLRRDAELADIAREAADVARGIETRALGVKRDDVSVTEIGVAWVPTAR